MRWLLNSNKHLLRPSLGQVSASSLHEAARLLAGRAATAKYGRNGTVMDCSGDIDDGENYNGKFTAVIGNKLGLWSIRSEVLHFTVEMVGKPTP